MPVIVNNNIAVESYTGCPKKLYLILRLILGAVRFSMTKVLVLPDSRDMYKSFGTLNACFHALMN